MVIDTLRLFAAHPWWLVIEVCGLMAILYLVAANGLEWWAKREEQRQAAERKRLEFMATVDSNHVALVKRLRALECIAPPAAEIHAAECKIFSWEHLCSCGAQPPDYDSAHPAVRPKAPRAAGGHSRRVS